MKTPTPEQIQADLDCVDREICGLEEESKSNFSGVRIVAKSSLSRLYVRQFALRFAIKMMEEPSDGMVTEGQYAYQETGEIGGDYAACDTAQFKAMRDQAIKEINNPRQPDAGNEKE